MGPVSGLEESGRLKKETTSLTSKREGREGSGGKTEEKNGWKSGLWGCLNSFLRNSGLIRHVGSNYPL